MMLKKHKDNIPDYSEKRLQPQIKIWINLKKILQPQVRV